MLNVTEVSSQKQWNSFLLNPSFLMPAFFQTWQWGEVQKYLGFEVMRLGLFKEKISRHVPNY